MDQRDESLCGLRYVSIPRRQNGFGFTLRHFIIYPPEVCSSNSSSEATLPQKLIKVTEPVDTIFVKSVREGGPAAGAGLCVGDRIVSVNGQRIVGKSYDQVVHLIQKSVQHLHLEVSPKQYDTLQLFYEDKAYRPETNQRPQGATNSHPHHRHKSTHSIEDDPPPRGGGGDYEPLFVEGPPPPEEDPYQSQSHPQNYNYNYQYIPPPQKMSSNEFSNQQQPLLSHLPRPTPYKSSTPTWSHLSTNHQRQSPTQSRFQQQQTYYPFQKPESNGAQLYGIREETAKSAESVQHCPASSTGRYGSMESLPNNATQWKPPPGHRYSIGPAEEVQPQLYVTMSGGVNEVDSNEMKANSQLQGYEVKMADRIRKSCEQKEEFLRRPNQPWVPVAAPPTGFPKEFYAQPQKFQKVPWPPESKAIMSSAPPSSSTTTEVPTKEGRVDQLRSHSSSLDETSNRRQDPLVNKLKTKSSVDLQPTDYTSNMIGKNRLTVVGGGKLHCDPPKDWVPSNLVAPNSVSMDQLSTLLRPNYIQLPGTLLSAVSRSRQFSQRSASTTSRLLDPNVILRRREATTDLDDGDRLVRRVSYLKATSSPIDMDRRNASSPTTPTKSPTSEFRHFGSTLAAEKGQDVSEVLREGPVHFKVRAGDAKKAGYYRSWRTGYAQVRRSGSLYLSKEKSANEADVILRINLREGAAIEPADDYTKRKYVVRIKTSTTPSTVGGTPTPVEILLQIEDPFLQLKWIQTLQQQQDNNNQNPSEVQSALLRSFLNAPNSPYLTLQGNSSPKSKTWKGKVARRWKKISSTSNSSTSQSLGATFGVPLEDTPQSESTLVPKILEFCVETVEERGLGIVGIYRIPGNNAAIGGLIESLNRGSEPNPEQDPRWKDVHVISSLLKSFLRKLPDPLLTSALYPHFIEAVSKASPLSTLRSLINNLPDPNYETLRYLIHHLRRVADHCEVNRMEARNLAIIFGPTVVRTAEENVELLVNDMQHQCRIMELLINHVDELFRDKDNESPPPEEEKPVDTVPAQPRIESEIKASLLQAAQRKVLSQTVEPIQNVYGLPPTSSPRPVDSSTGLIRSYAGLGEETEQRVKQFELETRALLHREARSPILSNSKRAEDSATKRAEEDSSTKRAEGIKESRLRVEAEWRRAKHDLENEDFYDQLADDPSSIVEHRCGGLSHVSISSSPYGVSTWPARLGPTPFKLPPTQTAVKLTGNCSEYDCDAAASATTLKRLKNYESLNCESKAFGSLDSLRDVGSREDLEAGRDEENTKSPTGSPDNKSQLVTTPTNKKQLQEKKDLNSTPAKLDPPNHYCNGSTVKSPETVQKTPRRSKSMISRRRSDITPTEKESADYSQITLNSTPQLTKEAKTVSNKLRRECRRRHSLNGTAADILRSLMFGKSTEDAPLNTVAMLSSGNLLESHV